MNRFTTYIGVFLVVIGAIVLTLSYFLSWVDNNWIQGGAYLLMIAGVVVHRFCVGSNV